MSFKSVFHKRHRSVRWLCLFLAFQHISCTPKIGEDPPPAKNLGVTPSPCLDHATDSIGDFVRGDGKPAEISEAWGCLSSAFIEFKKYIRGRISDRYSPQELETFIEDNFIERSAILARKKQISPELQSQMMKIKVILIGGSTEYLTRTELGDIINLLSEFRRMSIAINPAMKILTMHWKPDNQINDSQLEEFEQANMAIQTFAKDISNLVKKNNPSYDLNDVPILLRELEKFSGESLTWLPKLDQYIPLVKKVKKAVAGGEESFVSPREWRIFMLLGGRAYVQYLRYYYFLSKDSEDTSGSRAAFIARTFEDIFSIFQDLVGEKPSGQVSRIETNEILEAVSNVWPDFKTSDNFVFEIMKIKKMALGGSIEFWSTKDFESAKLKVNILKGMITTLLPFRRVYTLNWNNKVETQEKARSLFSDARFQLTQALKELGGQFEEGYSSSDLISLLKELEKLYPPKEGETSFAQTAIQYSCVAKDIKRMLFDERKANEHCTIANGIAENWDIEKGQWAKFLGIASQFYASFLQYKYFILGNAYTSSKEGEALNWFGNDTINLIKDTLAQRKKPVLTTEEITTIALGLSEADVIPKEVKPSTIDVISKALVNKFLNPPEDRLNGVTPRGIDDRLLENLSNEFSVWSKLDLFFMDLYERKQSSLLNGELLLEVKAGLEKYKNDPHLMSGLNEMKLVFSTPIPMTLDNDGRVIISYGNEQRLSLQTLKQSNLSRLLVRLLTRAYGLNLNRITTNKGVQKCEAELAYADISGIFVDLGLLEPGKKSFIASRFTEANIFLPHSDGDQLVSFQEFHDLVTMIFSGVVIDKKLRVDLLKKCGGSRDLSRSTDTVSLSCLRESYRNNVKRDFASTPEYLRYFDQTSPAAWNQSFFENLKAAGYPPNDQQLVKMGDASLFPHIIQYTEMLFAKFDQNRDAVISKSDTLLAFPTFKGLLLDLAKEQIADGTIEVDELEAVFTYIVKYAKIPGCDKSPSFFCLFDGDVIQWLLWKNNYKRPDRTIYADRNQIAKILGLIADQVRKPPTGPAPPVPKCE